MDIDTKKELARFKLIILSLGVIAVAFIVIYSITRADNQLSKLEAYGLIEIECQNLEPQNPTTKVVTCGGIEISWGLMESYILRGGVRIYTEPHFTGDLASKHNELFKKSAIPKSDI